MFGLICNDEISLVGHCLFLNFRSALYNILGKEHFKDIKTNNDLQNITHLFIVDEHFGPNVNIWKNNEFIERVNQQNIKVIVFNFEKIIDSAFPWNIDHQKFLEKFSNLTQLLTDMNDLKVLKTPFLNKQLLSKDTYVLERNWDKITDRVLFIGQTDGACYLRRRELLKNISQYIPVEIINTKRRYTYDTFLDTLAKYKYVLNPLGAGDFLNLRYYEIIKLNSIPIQQTTSAMNTVYTELNEDRSINFETPEQLKNINFQSFKQNKSNMFLEDYFLKIDLISLIAS